jgi:Mn2+/Fe2+ NRAMP family transporter
LAAESNESGPRPPTGFWATAAWLGPGFILVGSIVGSGELIATPTLAARTGYTFLWLILFSCFIKVFFQIEIGRYAISTGKTTLEAFQEVSIGVSLGGRKIQVNWLGWLWLIMVSAAIVQQGAMVGGTAQAILLARGEAEGATDGMAAAGDKPVWLALAIAASVTVLLLSGRYSVVERVAMALVGFFTAATLYSVIRLQFTPSGASASDLIGGFRFELPADSRLRRQVLADALMAFGITGVGASELIAYPYWCLEKGYGRLIGPQGADKEEWAVRARGWIRVMAIDAWVCMVVFTVATLAFFVLGAAMLHPKGVVPQNEKMMQTLGDMYAATFGPWTGVVFIVGGVAVLYSTLFVSTAAHSRMMTDWLGLLGAIDRRNEETRKLSIAILCVIFPLIATAAYLWIRDPVLLVQVSGVVQSLMLPLLGGTILFLSYRRTDRRLRGGVLWYVALWTAYALMSGTSIVMLVQTLTG